MPLFSDPLENCEPANQWPQDPKWYRDKIEALETVIENKVKALETELQRFRDESEKLKNILSLDQPYDIFETLNVLSEAAVHLLSVHDCDCQGYEIIKAAMESAKKILEAHRA